MPRPLLYPFAFAAQVRAYVTRREPYLTIDGLRMAKHRVSYCSAKAELALCDRARPYPEALKEALAWFRDSGQLR